MSANLAWPHVLAVSIGALIGSLLRWQAGLWLNLRWSGFPLGTLVVNCAGALVIGAALCWFERSPNELWRLFIITGFCGGFTTFSAFSGESLLLLQRGEGLMALAHTLAHVLGALASAAVGYRLAQAALA